MFSIENRVEFHQLIIRKICDSDDASELNLIWKGNFSVENMRERWQYIEQFGELR